MGRPIPTLEPPPVAEVKKPVENEWLRDLRGCFEFAVRELENGKLPSEIILVSTTLTGLEVRALLEAARRAVTRRRDP